MKKFHLIGTRTRDIRLIIIELILKGHRRRICPASKCKRNIIIYPEKRQSRGIKIYGSHMYEVSEVCTSVEGKTKL
jgi:hypothetical protein